MCKSISRRLSKRLVVSSALDQYLVLLASTFAQKFTDFDQDNLPHFRTLLKIKSWKSYVYGGHQSPFSSRSWKIFLSTGGGIEGEPFLSLWKSCFLVPFSWVIYLLFRHYEPLNSLMCKSVSLRMSKKLVVSSAMDQCLVLLASTFVQNFTDFDQDNFPHFRALVKQKGKPGKKNRE